MHIILKGFDDRYCKHLTEGITTGLPIELCISIGDKPEVLPDLGNAEHIHMIADDLRKGIYRDVDWSKLTPLDEELIESMRQTEAVFLKMVARYAIYRDLPYVERKRQYLRHLRYWNHMLDEKKIDLFVMRGAPHQCYDLVIWDLCKRKGIRTMTMALFFAVDAFSVEENWEESGKAIGERCRELQKEYADPNTPVPLSEEYEEYYDRFSVNNKKPWYMSTVHRHLLHKSFFGKWAGAAFRVLVRKPFYLLSSVVSVDFWRRKWNHHTTRKLYDALAKQPDLTVPYVYAPLHMQPEATTCPMSGVFVDQELISQLLAGCLPEGVRIYVKEHPNQSELWRDREFYETLNAIPQVTLVPRDFDSFTLSDHAVATASGTGTACLEGLFKGKPAFMFGHKYFQYAPGVHRIRSLADCRKAVDDIFNKNIRPTLREMRMFLKAIEDVTGVCYKVSSTVRPDEDKYERARKMGEYVNKKILEGM